MTQLKKDILSYKILIYDKKQKLKELEIASGILYCDILRYQETFQKLEKGEQNE